MWTQEDTDLALALTAIEAERCDSCGQSRIESMDPDLEFDWVADPLRCHACATRDREARAAAGPDGKGWDDAGIRWATSRREEVTGDA